MWPSAGAGAKGKRWYDWAWITIEPGRPGHRRLLIRRSRRTRELAFCRGYCPHRVPLATLVTAAGTRRSTEENPGRPGADRTGRAPGPDLDPRHRWATLAMLALAFLTITAAAEHAQPRRR